MVNMTENICLANVCHCMTPLETNLVNILIGTQK